MSHCHRKPSAWAAALGFWYLKPEPWAVTGLSDGLWWPWLPMARLGQLKALSLSRHITKLANICGHVEWNKKTLAISWDSIYALRKRGEHHILLTLPLYMPHWTRVLGIWRESSKVCSLYSPDHSSASSTQDRGWRYHRMKCSSSLLSNGSPLLWREHDRSFQ